MRTFAITALIAVAASLRLNDLCDPEKNDLCPEFAQMEEVVEGVLNSQDEEKEGKGDFAQKRVPLKIETRDDSDE